MITQEEYARESAEGLTGVRHGSVCWLDQGDGDGHTQVTIIMVHLIINGLTVVVPNQPALVRVKYTVGAEIVEREMIFETTRWLEGAVPPIITTERTPVEVQLYLNEKKEGGK